MQNMCRWYGDGHIRFAAEQPNECWQSDFTHYPLAGGTGTEILGWLDDHSRLVLRLTCHSRVTGPVVVAAFRAAVAAYGAPASTLTDNGMVFTTGSPAAAAAATAWKTSCVGSACGRRTAGRTTHRPRAKSNGSGRRCTNSSLPGQPSPPPSPSSRPS